MSDANTRYLRAARSRIRAAATLLRSSIGLESMPANVAAELRLEAIDLDDVASLLDLAERDVNRHVARWNRRRKGAKS